MPLIGWFYFDSLTLLFWPLFRGWGRNPYKNFVGFLVNLKTLKGHYEINWPLLCVSFLLFDRKHLEKVLKKSWSTITLGWFVFALLLASRLLLLGKQTMGWGGGQNSLSGLHVHASTNQFFLPGTNAKRLEYRLLTSAPGWSHGKHFGILTQRSGVWTL